MYRAINKQKILRYRAQLLADIRSFFHARGVLEVETPLLASSTIPSPHIQSFKTQFLAPSPPPSSSLSSSSPATPPFPAGSTLYLQTSPEFAMKRLLAQQSGDILQICKAFRNGERGTLHNPEFTILEWYRVGYDHHKLMDEMDDLLRTILHLPAAAQRFTYAALFERYLNINPHRATLTELQHCAKEHGINIDWDEQESDVWLQLLMTHCIEPELAASSAVPVFVYDFPAEQAALARLRRCEKDGEIEIVAERFEVYFKGIELANGFHELNDAKEQRARFERELEWRRAHGMECPPLDEEFLAMLSEMPDCAGVALGVDRLLMLLLGIKDIAVML